MPKMVVKLIEKGVFGKNGYSRPSLFWDVKWCMLLLCYRRFGTGCRFHLNVPAVKGCLNHDDGANTLYRNVGNQLPTHTA